MKKVDASSACTNLQSLKIVYLADDKCRKKKKIKENLMKESFKPYSQHYDQLCNYKC